MNIHSSQKSRGLDLVSHIVGYRHAKLKHPLDFLSIFVLLIAGIFFIQDIYVDIVVEGKDVSHVVVEGGVFIGILLALGFELIRAMKLSSSEAYSRQEITRLKQHLSAVIDKEFESWHLTLTEKEIALLLIKGFSMQEIAEIRHVKEKSVRQQASGIYAKSGLANRYELTSHFIEDMLAPADS